MFFQNIIINSTMYCAVRADFCETFYFCFHIFVAYFQFEDILQLCCKSIAMMFFTVLLLIFNI